MDIVAWGSWGSVLISKIVFVVIYVVIHFIWVEIIDKSFLPSLRHKQKKTPRSSIHFLVFLFQVFLPHDLPQEIENGNLYLNYWYSTWSSRQSHSMCDYPVPSWWRTRGRNTWKKRDNKLDISHSLLYGIDIKQSTNVKHFKNGFRLNVLPFFHLHITDHIWRPKNTIFSKNNNIL